jgi:hypothetical protein
MVKPIDQGDRVIVKCRRNIKQIGAGVVLFRHTKYQTWNYGDKVIKVGRKVTDRYDVQFDDGTVATCYNVINEPNENKLSSFWSTAGKISRRRTDVLSSPTSCNSPAATACDSPVNIFFESPTSVVDLNS